MKKIIIIGDSCALPREEILYHKIYSQKLRLLEDVSIENTSIANNNSYFIQTNIESFMLYGYNPDIVILNYGIVDVFPRPYPNKVYRLLTCTGLLSYVDKALKITKLYYKLGDYFKFKEVPIEKFKIYSENIVKKLLEKNVKKIVIIGIIKPYKILLKSKIVEKEIVLYNEVYRQLSKKYNEVKYIDIYNDSNEEFTIWDGYHYSEVASKYIANEIERLILND